MNTNLHRILSAVLFIGVLWIGGNSASEATKWICFAVAVPAGTILQLTFMLRK